MTDTPAEVMMLTTIHTESATLQDILYDLEFYWEVLSDPKHEYWKGSQTPIDQQFNEVMAELGRAQDMYWRSLSALVQSAQDLVLASL